MESSTAVITEAEGIKQKWDQLKKQNPKMRSREIANRLGISEAELLASSCDGFKVIRLKNDWEGIFQRLHNLGALMALTRNNAAVHEKYGIYQNISFRGHAGLVLDDQIDLRVLHKRWAFCFAVSVEKARSTLHSLQFFNKSGTAVHKIYLKDHSNLELFRKLANNFKSANQSATVAVDDSVKQNGYAEIEHIETDAFLDEWSALRDTHDFFPLLRKFKLRRTDALKIAKEKYSWKISNNSTLQMLKMASKDQVPIMVFVRNSGMIQIHTGPVHTIKVIADWINILDPEFNLHLRSDLIDSSWIVEKPTKDGIVTSLELFDQQGEQIATFFGARKPGKKELDGWRQITLKLKQQNC